MKIYVVDSKNTKIPIEINEDDTVKTLKELIKTKMGINKDILLHMNGQIFIDDNQKLEEYDIEENSTVTFVMQFRAGRLIIIIK